MKGRKIFTELSPEEVKELFGKDKELEKHSTWQLFGDYTSPRVGIHVYETKKGLKGYYEDGTLNRYGRLQNLKTWFSLKIKPTDGGSIVSYKVKYNPYFLILCGIVLFWTLSGIVKKEWNSLFGNFVSLILIIIFLNSAFNDEDAIFQIIRKRLGVIDDEKGNSST